MSQNELKECPMLKSWVYIGQACANCSGRAFLCHIESIPKRPDKVAKLKRSIMADYKFNLQELFEKMTEYRLPLDKAFFEWSKEEMIELGKLFGLCAIVKDENEEEIPF
jgi:hypothetical protein